MEFVNVFKTYGNGTETLQGVNLKVEKDEFVFIVGSSGAGKGTLLKLITCEEAPNSSEIIANDEELSTVKRRDTPCVRHTMRMIFQDFRLIDKMTIFGNVAFVMHMVGASQREIRKRVPYMLNLMGLKEKINCRPEEFSGGGRQGAGLTRVLVDNPSMIIADEPTSNIDSVLPLEIVGLSSEINHRGTTVLMVTHKHRLVKHFRHRAVETHDGLVVVDSCNLILEVPDGNWQC